MPLCPTRDEDEYERKTSAFGRVHFSFNECQRRSVKPDSMWQHRLTRPLHVPGMYSIRFTA